MQEPINLDVYHEFLTTHCSKLSDWDLDALLQGLNYIGFAIGLGCFFVIKDEIQYRSFNGEVPLLMCNGKQCLNFLIKNSNIEFVTWWTPDRRSLTTPMWKPKPAIAQEVIEFLGLNQGVKPEFWAHFCSYDWVVLCQLFGRMVDLPKGMPFYCNDIKQLENELGNPPLPQQQGSEHDALQDAKWNAQIYQYLNNLKQPRSLFVGDRL